jgi:hypothetical protein
VHADPIKPVSTAPGIKRLKLEYEEPVLNVAFNFNLRRYTKELHGGGRGRRA